MTIFRRRIFLFIAGFAALLGAQYLIAKTDSPVIPLAFALPLQDFFRFDLPNLENVIVGVVLLIIASILILLSLPAFSLPQWDQSAQHLAQSGFSLRQFLRRHVVLLIAAAVLFALLIVRLSHADVSAAPFFLWIVVLALLLIVAFRYDRKAGTPLSLRLNRWDMLWIGGLLLFALLIGTYQLDRLPNSLVSDEGNFWTRAKTIADGQEIQSFFDVAVYSYPLASSFYQGAILRIFGYSLASWRFSSVLAGVLVVIPLYLLARDLFDRRTAVIAGLLLVTLPYLVAFERLGYNNAQAIYL